ncbi:hypothetical protein ANCCAN_19718 [Ancylostoma caninum]|uniref:Uncharacterized protein n=1 Tax=Ancylostoma caninum TaxID=29170 RepID=A0A368FSH6_ANCCA|nr:hypothetical protein ANCCAN_19718 [Ancylostoma caninum]
MFMSITLDTEAMSRRKRSPAVCMPEDKEPGCCLYDLTEILLSLLMTASIQLHCY